MSGVPPAPQETRRQQRQSRGTDECFWHAISLQKVLDKTLSSSKKKGFDLIFEYRISTLVKVNEQKKGVENF